MPRDLSSQSAPVSFQGEGEGEGGAADGKKAKAKSKAKAPPSSSLPLTLAPKVRRDMLLLETADPSLDLSGDFGIIGRLSANAGGSGPAVTLDLKGKVSDGDVVPCNTMCVLAIDGAKARIETVFTDFVQLQVTGAPLLPLPVSTSTSTSNSSSHLFHSLPLQPPRTSIMDMETVTTGDLGGDFFDDGEPVFGDDSDEEAGPLREGKAKAAAAKGKGKGKRSRRRAPSAPARRRRRRRSRRRRRRNLSRRSASHYVSYYVTPKTPRDAHPCCAYPPQSHVCPDQVSPAASTAAQRSAQRSARRSGRRRWRRGAAA